MTAVDPIVKALQKELSDLKLRLIELGEENRDLRIICNENGIQYEERLSAQRHRRYFSKILAEHPLWRDASAVLSALPPHGEAPADGNLSVDRAALPCNEECVRHILAYLPPDDLLANLRLVNKFHRRAVHSTLVDFLFTLWEDDDGED